MNTSKDSSEKIVRIDSTGSTFEYLNEIVRCKDCEWYEIAYLKKDGTDDRRYKPTWCTLWRAEMSEEDFCSAGTRRRREEE